LGTAEAQRLGAARRVVLIQNLDSEHESSLLKNQEIEAFAVSLGRWFW
jgi:hypothetical protein